MAEFEHGGVRAVIVGGYAVAFHGRPRATKDIDVLLEGSADNLARAAAALEAFGAPPHVVEATRTIGPDEIVYLGHPPLRIHLLRAIDGVAPSASSRTRSPRSSTEFGYTSSVSTT